MLLYNDASAGAVVSIGTDLYMYANVMREKEWGKKCRFGYVAD